MGRDKLASSSEAIIIIQDVVDIPIPKDIRTATTWIGCLEKRYMPLVIGCSCGVDAKVIIAAIVRIILILNNIIPIQRHARLPVKGRNIAYANIPRLKMVLLISVGTFHLNFPVGKRKNFLAKDFP